MTQLHSSPFSLWTLDLPIRIRFFAASHFPLHVRQNLLPDGRVLEKKPLKKDGNKMDVLGVEMGVESKLIRISKVERMQNEEYVNEEFMTWKIMS